MLLSGGCKGNQTLETNRNKKEMYWIKSWQMTWWKSGKGEIQAAKGEELVIWHIFAFLLNISGIWHQEESYRQIETDRQEREWERENIKTWLPTLAWAWLLPQPSTEDFDSNEKKGCINK